VGAVTSWYGTTASWWVPLEAGARRRFGTDLHHDYCGGQLAYTIADLEVPGTPPTVEVSIRFWAQPGYDTFGLAPEDFPRVHAERRAASPHRYSDDALCLWSPFDPIELRWHHQLGLLDLIEITRRHLGMERYWRMTGGHRSGVWLLADAPHGTPAA
jgi:hypothetical protein